MIKWSKNDGGWNYPNKSLWMIKDNLPKRINHDNTAAMKKSIFLTKIKFLLPPKKFLISHLKKIVHHKTPKNFSTSGVIMLCGMKTCL